MSYRTLQAVDEAERTFSYADADGRTCCTTTLPHMILCADCTAAFHSDTHHSPTPASSGRTLHSPPATLRTVRAATADDKIPPPPDLTAAIIAARAQLSEIKSWERQPPVTVTPTLRAAAPNAFAPPPPDLTAAIIAARAKEGRR